MSARRPTTVELCAGIGGFSSPRTHALAFVEISAACRAILRRHYPHALILSDVTSTTGTMLPRPNILKFGFPCQDLSVAGARIGLAGARSSLFYECTRIVDELRPDFALWENVPGLLSSDDGRDFARVLMELERIGYCGCWTSLDAQFFGVAQRRQRVFGLFARRDIGAARCAEILSLAARLPWNIAPRREARARVASAVTASAGHHGHSSPRGDGSDNLIAFDWRASETTYSPVRSDGLAGTLGTLKQDAVAVFGGNNTRGERGVAAALTSHGGGRYDFESENFVVAGAQRSGHGGPDDNSAQSGHLVAVSVAENQRGELRTADIAAQLTSGGGKPGQGYPAVLAFTERTRAEGRTLEAQEDLAYALTNPGSGGRQKARQSDGNACVRRLTPREYERLQGFDDGWTAWGIDEDGHRIEMSDSQRYRMLGNAICRKVSAWIDSQIVKYL